MFSKSLPILKLLIDRDEDCLLMETKTGSTSLDLANERIEWVEGTPKEGFLMALGHVPTPPSHTEEKKKAEKKDTEEERKGEDAVASAEMVGLDTQDTTDSTGKKKKKKKKKKFLGIF